MITNKLLENVTKLKYFETAEANQNCSHEYITFNSENAYDI